MAWYAIYKWASTFRKIPFERNWIAWYREKLYNEWFEGLSEDDKAKVLAYREKKKKEEDEKFANSLFALSQILSAMCGDRYIGGKYLK